MGGRGRRGEVWQIPKNSSTAKEEKEIHVLQAGKPKVKLYKDYKLKVKKDILVPTQDEKKFKLRKFGQTLPLIIEVPPYFSFYKLKKNTFSQARYEFDEQMRKIAVSFYYNPILFLASTKTATSVTCKNFETISIRKT